MDDDQPQTRLTYREEVSFPIQFMHGNAVSSTGFASDISLDGIRLWSDTALQNGTRLHLSFTLPEYVLYPNVEPGHPLPRSSNKSQRAFSEMRMKGLVVARLPSTSEKLPHGIKFIDLHPVDREEVARFIHVLQIYKLAQSKVQQTEKPHA